MSDVSATAEKKKRTRSGKRKKVKKIKGRKIQTIFCLISLIFIIGCFIFYGERMIKYYRVYNPKSDSGVVLSTLSSAVISNSSIVYEGEGLYINNGNYIYKGMNVNNYIIINNMMFRIIKINSDKTIDVVLDDYINKLKWDDKLVSFSESSINKYITDKFLPVINKDLLYTTGICTDLLNNISDINCDNFNLDAYIRLLGLSDFLNSIVDNKSYLVDNGDPLWLYDASETGVWHTNGNNVSVGVQTERYGIKPVLTLKNSVSLINGDGSKENPYQVDNDNTIGVGSYVDINDDIYIVYEVGKDYYKLQSDKLISEKVVFDTTTSDYKNSYIKKYLESTFIKKLSYQDLLKTITWDNDVEANVNILTDDDLKFNSNLDSYFLDNKVDNKVSLYNGNLLTSIPSTKRSVRAAIAIVKDFEVLSGNGSKLAPFIVEVK